MINKMAAGSNFEVQLGQLADAELSQNAPSLVPYKVGFQLIDKDDDETRGVGVMVYKVNKQWMYIPVFFLNNRLRGLDLMYLPDKSQFVPAKENWISYLKGEQPLVLGEDATEEEQSEISRGAPGSVDIEDNTDPFFKSAGLIKVAELDDMTRIISNDINAFALDQWIPRLGKEAAVCFAETLTSNPEFANAILTFYDSDALTSIAKQADERAANSSKGSVDLKVITPDMPDAQDLTSSEKEALIKDQYFVVDNRKETTTVFDGKVDHTSLQTPTCEGVYDILMGDSSFNRFYVLFPRKGRTDYYKPELRTTRSSKFLLVPVDKKDKYLCATQELQGKLLDPNMEELKGIRQSLGKEATRLVRERYNDCILIDKAGNNYELYFEGPRTVVGDKIKINLKYGKPGEARDVKFMSYTKKDGDLFIGGDTLYVPKGTKVIEKMGYNEKDKYSFGNPNTLVSELVNKVNLKPIKVYSDGTSVVITADKLSSDKDPQRESIINDGEIVNQGPMSKKAAVMTLVRYHGIDAPTAKQMVKSAAAPYKPNAERFLVKYAADYPNQTTEGISLGAQEAPFEQTDDKAELPAHDIQEAVDASDKGVKEVMDVSVLKALATNSSSLDLVDDYLSDMFTGMDRVGRLLFLFYWHNDDFSERYGPEEMTELEDSLRGVFNSLSDLILFLRKKTVSPDSVMDSLAGDLAEDVGA
jgi:hypothetical protein